MEETQKEELSSFCVSSIIDYTFSPTYYGYDKILTQHLILSYVFYAMKFVLFQLL